MMKRVEMYLLVIVMGVVLLPSYTKDFQQKNANPNAITDVTPELLLPGILRSTVNQVVNESWGIGNIVIQHSAKIQFVSEDRYTWGDRDGRIKNLQPENFEKLTEFEKRINNKAFTTNRNYPYYHQLEAFTYDDNGTERSIRLPKGDNLHQFRNDVDKGNLSAVSWLVAPQNFSDHPSSPWYGAWYVSEALAILTKNPEVWKKTVFILTYDENDGYFDHVPPFVAPKPKILVPAEFQKV
jgi:hypothetical protein